MTRWRLGGRRGRPGAPGRCLLLALAAATLLALAGADAAMASFNTTEGTAFSGAVDTPSCTPTSAITINWGDGSSSAGTYDGANVNGSHTYAEEGNYSGTASFTCANGATSDSFTATVDDQALTIASNGFSATAGQQFSGAAAGFTDADPGGTASDYAAAIDWGDGSSSAGQVTATGGGFAVNGSHTYQTVGNYTVNVTVTDQSPQGGNGGVSQASSNVIFTAHVARAPGKFRQCPPIGADGGCQFLIVVTDQGTTVLEDTSQPPYENNNDALVGVQNNSSSPIDALPLSASTGLFGFDGDGICDIGTGPVPSGCQPPPGSPAGTTCGQGFSDCSFPAPVGQPKGYKEPGALTGSTQNGYEGPTTWFSNVATDTNSGHVNFSPSVAPGGSTYFGLQAPPSANGLKVGRPTNFPLPPPVLGKSFNVQVVSGRVLIRLPHTGTGRAGFVKLTGAQQLPAGTQVDARHGVIKLVAARPHSRKTEDGKFGRAIFKITQSRRGVGITTLGILEGLFPGAPSFASCRPGSHRVLQTLRASDRRHFRSRGGYASATVRGTKWITIDRCDGTLVIVQRGSVVVDDFVRHIRLVVPAGHQYLAKAPNPRR
jgi:PKD repeat protein